MVPTATVPIATVVAGATKNPMAVGKRLDGHGQFGNGQTSAFHQRLLPIIQCCGSSFQLARLRHIEQFQGRLPVDFFQWLKREVRPQW